MCCLCLCDYWYSDSILVDLYPPFRRHSHTWMHTLMHMYTPHTHAHAKQICMYIYAHDTAHAHAHTHNTLCTQDGSSSLHVASLKGHDRFVEKLLQGKATVDLQTKVVVNCSVMYSNSFYYPVDIYVEPSWLHKMAHKNGAPCQWFGSKSCYFCV